jgi:hypothetical protein
MNLKRTESRTESTFMLQNTAVVILRHELLNQVYINKSGIYREFTVLSHVLHMRKRRAGLESSCIGRGQ